MLQPGGGLMGRLRPAALFPFWNLLTSRNADVCLPTSTPKAMTLGGVSSAEAGSVLGEVGLGHSC